jgi:hypothetical protein
VSTKSDEDLSITQERPPRGLRPPPLPWVLFAIAFATALVFYFLWQGQKAEERRRADVRTTATDFLEALTNFDGATIDEDVEEIRSFAVGDFADQVDQFFDDAAVTAIRDARARSEGVIQDVFVQSIEGGTASAFGVVNESITNASSGAPRRELLRVDMELIQTTEGWKVSSVSILQSTRQGPFASPSP